ncbi:MAG: nucleoside-diphosphate sugar epimerase [Xanthomonadaceae bacterium]|nr:nucleoside-diphosphate sugar epimerase [Xanthomonadaceae bacterium]
MPPAPSTPSLLLIGLSGQIGDALDTTALPAPALALSRQPAPSARPGIVWQAGDLAGFRADRPFAAVLSLGPLDRLAEAFDAGRLRAGHVVAFGSTSRWAKAASPDPAERALAQRLAAAEDRLAAVQARAGGALTLLRPTLVWGAGRDATLSRVVGWARRWPLLPLPLGAPGRRQPVHVADLAAVALRALALGREAGGGFDLPGGEALPFGVMLARSVAVAAPGCRLLPLPWRPLAAWGRRRGAGALARLGEDLLFDAGPAQAVLGWAPRGFQPVAADFTPRA